MPGFGLLGRTLGHSFSPRIHKMLGKYPYSLIELEENELAPFMRDHTLDGFNVTIPYKQAVIPYLSGMSDIARAIGSVNTVIRRPDGSLWGDNTDAYGFEALFGDASPFAGRKALVLGSGGSSKTVQAVLKAAGIHPVVISRHGEDNYQNLIKHQDVALIVNTTPLGMYPNNGEAPLSLSGFPGCRLVIDLIYNPYRTALLLEADSLGIEGRGGLLMLAAQAQRASELWGLISSGEDKSAVIAAELSKSMRNIALIGMPGCGKSSVALALRKLTGREILDTDELVEKKAGRPIPDIIAAQGIDAFRLMETEALREAGAQSGCILATGGGIVTQARNLPLLRQNSRVAWLQRELDLLPVTGRPISQGRGVEALYQERGPLYECWSEKSYFNEDIEQTARKIAEDML